MAAANNRNHNPSKSAYDILGVSSKHATQEEIKRQYRACCLKYHPDKNANNQKNCEQKFKQIQDAYDKIGKPESRRIYDMQQQQQRSPFFQQQQRSSGNSGQSSYYGFSSTTFDGTPNQFFNEAELRRAFQNAFQQSGNNSNKFYSFGTPSGRSRPHQFPTFREPPTSLKSIFVQKVFVPLETLYNGVDEYEFHMPSSNNNKNNNIISNIIASFRGGLGYFLLYQSFLYSIPIIKLTKWGAFATACMLFLHHLPQPSTRVFKARIRPGYKGGTRFIFTTPTSDDNHNNCVQVEFVIAEAKHDIYQREGNNLYTTIQISRKQAKYGCRIYLPSLDNHKDNNGNSNMIQIQIPPRTKMGDTIRIRGRGWYNRKQQHYGDLLVQVLIKRRPYFASSTT